MNVSSSFQETGWYTNLHNYPHQQWVSRNWNWSILTSTLALPSEGNACKSKKYVQDLEEGNYKTKYEELINGDVFHVRRQEDWCVTNPKKTKWFLIS